MNKAESTNDSNTTALAGPIMKTEDLRETVQEADIEENMDRNSVINVNGWQHGFIMPFTDLDMI